MKHKKTTNKVTQCEDGNPDCFHGGKAACTWCGTNNWDFNPKYNKNYCNRCGYAEDYPKSKCGQCGETIYRSSHTCSKAPPEPGSIEYFKAGFKNLRDTLPSKGEYVDPVLRAKQRAEPVEDKLTDLVKRWEHKDVLHNQVYCTDRATCCLSDIKSDVTFLLYEAYSYGKQELPMGIDPWIAHGKKYGYLNYVLSQERERQKDEMQCNLKCSSCDDILQQQI